MAWQTGIVAVREAHLSAALAECAADWPIAVKEYLFCLEEAEHASDERAVRFFAAKLALAYSAMGFLEKAAHYRDIESLTRG